ncbi:cation-efflux pump [Bacillus cereus]|uniref:Cation diffusion facilitator family transporter n=1 Tax=Bacillus paramycoides TaxID=2026194 RepID=A0ABU6N568_9BACI|nr:cation diffusion facilitator family transporter [Bacillus paramycoides]MED1568651.1 cation diffusion facilitator family transporter [Bacillus paramycoides]PFM56022.1 cation-efflux pump [Bacillus cereus]
MNESRKSSLFAAWISVISNVLLTLIKITVGIFSKSQVLLADGIHNAADVVASVVSLGSMKISNQPADEDHPYGHGKAEVVSSGFVAIILIFAALFMTYESIKALFHPATEPHMIAFIAAIISLIWKQILYVYTIRIGRQANSKGLIATAYDHLADVYASIAAVIGIGIALLNNLYPIPFAAYGDPLAGIIVSFFVLKLAFGMGKEAIYILMEGGLPNEKCSEYKKMILAHPYVKRIDRIRARNHGHYILIDVRISVPAYLSIQQGHDICREIKTAIMKQDSEVYEVLIHLNPWYEEK